MHIFEFQMNYQFAHLPILVLYHCSALRLFDLAYYSPSDMSEFGLSSRLHRCICELLASPEPYEFLKRDEGSQAAPATPPSWCAPVWAEPQVATSQLNWTSDVEWHTGKTETGDWAGRCSGQYAVDWQAGQTQSVDWAQQTVEWHPGESDTGKWAGRCNGQQAVDWQAGQTQSVDWAQQTVEWHPGESDTGKWAGRCNGQQAVDWQAGQTQSVDWAQQTVEWHPGESDTGKWAGRCNGQQAVDWQAGQTQSVDWAQQTVEWHPGESDTGKWAGRCNGQQAVDWQAGQTQSVDWAQQTVEWHPGESEIGDLDGRCTGKEHTAERPFSKTQTNTPDTWQTAFAEWQGQSRQDIQQHFPQLHTWHSEQPNGTLSAAVQPSEWLDQGLAEEQTVQLDPSEESKQRQYVEEFCRIRELTRAAARKLREMDTSSAHDVVYSLEIEKRGLTLKPDEWSKIVSSRAQAKATAGVLDDASIERINSLLDASGLYESFCVLVHQCKSCMFDLEYMIVHVFSSQCGVNWGVFEHLETKVVMRAAILSREAASELRSTLRNLSPSELDDVLRDSNFTERVPYGSIENPAAYVHSMAKQTRRSQVAKSMLGNQ